MLALFAAVCLCIATCETACYWRNGTADPDFAYKACDTDPLKPLSKICCNSDHDECLPNGLYQNVETHVYWRETCTNKTWELGGCLELCSREISQSKSDVVVTPCDGTSSSQTWCCGTTTDCCEEGSELPRYSVARRFGDPTSILVTSSSFVSSAAVSPGPSGTSDTSAKNKTELLSRGTKAGTGVDAGLGAVVLFAAGIMTAKVAHRRKRRSELSSWRFEYCLAPVELESKLCEVSEIPVESEGTSAV
ncbi:hypothetical protein BU23DRAFT_326744 [Bimuria novae-zelandiae CBS 107.79]|uniref:Uncharacterized protein n=1 Tax=Bimuria novae-zelandiae CBS 107.79 TaxID=1447943 RepID=A0A6A5URG6_9PLEO|nr:hypothetical protein BU23DRAFT_326744 [Bimuria novae-zelandiae CBS 107.79]